MHARAAMAGLVLLGMVAAPALAQCGPAFATDCPASACRLPGLDGVANAIVEFDDGGGAALYVGGAFTVAGQTRVSNLARWDGLAWHDVGGGTNGVVHALIVHGGRLIVGGAFTQAGGVDCARIAAWDGAVFTPLGAAMDDAVFALADFGGDLVAGGKFTTADGIDVNHAARWDGALWHGLAEGVAGDVYALHEFGGELYAGGKFQEAGTIGANSVARWDGAEWRRLGDVFDNGVTGAAFSVNALALFEGQIVLGGSFAGAAGGVAAPGVAAWDGVAFHALADGIDGEVRALAVVGGILHAGGGFQFAAMSADPLPFLATWTGSAWASVGGGTNAPVRALGAIGGDLVAGGDFTAAGDVGAAHIARRSGSDFLALGDGFNAPIRALTVHATELIAAGDFLSMPGGAASRIARFDGAAWQSIGGGVDGRVLATASFAGELIAAGEFTHAGGVPADRIARWDGAAWSPIGSGFDQPVSSLLAENGVLYAGGDFSLVDGVAANSVAAWDGAAWSALGGGLSGNVTALALFNGELIAGGEFTDPNAAFLFNIARFDGAAWQQLGAGLDGPVRTLAVFNGELYAGGEFRSAGGAPANGLARWNGASWAEPPNWPGGAVRLLAVLNGSLYVGGEFAETGSDRFFRRFDGANWVAVGEGLNSVPLAAVQSGDALWLGGEFSLAAGAPAGMLARLDAVGAGVPPSIVTQPASHEGCAGLPVTLTIVADGTPPLSYQWRRAGVDIPGANAADFSIGSPVAVDSDSYDCVVTNACSFIVSDAATVTIFSPPTIVNPPRDAVLCEGQAATLSVTATGTGPLAYQWRFNGENIDGATDRELEIADPNAADAGEYDCVVTNLCGSITTDVATTVLGALPLITADPTDTQVCLGSRTTLTVAAEAIGDLTYQWRIDGLDIPDATAAEFVLHAVSLDNGGQYDCLVSSSCGSVASATATVIVRETPLISGQPRAQSVCPGETATFSVAASTGEGITYQWRRNSVNIDGATGAEYSVDNVDATHAGRYEVVIRSDCGSVTSVVASLSLKRATRVVNQTGSTQISAGQRASFKVTAVGEGTLRYQWMRDGAPLADGGTISGAKSRELILSAATAADAGAYQVEVTGECGVVRGDAMSLSVSPPPGPPVPDVLPNPPTTGEPTNPGNGGGPPTTPIDDPNQVGQDAPEIPECASGLMCAAGVAPMLPLTLAALAGMRIRRWRDRRVR